MVELDQMPRALDEPELRPGNELVQTMGTIDGNPGVLASPHEDDRDVQLRVQTLDLVRVCLIGLSDLPIERGLSMHGATRTAWRPVRGQCG